MQHSSIPRALRTLVQVAHQQGNIEVSIEQLEQVVEVVLQLGIKNESLSTENIMHKSQAKLLKKKIRKISTKIEKKEEECQIANRYLSSLRDTYENKVNRLLKEIHKNDISSKNLTQILPDKYQRSTQTQCEILNQSLVKELQSKNLFLLRKIHSLEKQLEEEKTENNSKNLYIESLLSMLDTQIESQMIEETEESLEDEAVCQDNYDISTLDADSLKGEEGLPEMNPNPQAQTIQFDAQFIPPSRDWFKSVKHMVLNLWNLLKFN